MRNWNGWLILAILALMLMPLPQHGPVQGAVFDLMHAPAAAIVAWVAFHGWRGWLPRSDTAAWLIVVALVFGTGIAIELGQAWTGRSATMHDALANGFGAAAAFAWARRTREAPGLRRTGYAALAAALFVAAMAEPLLILSHAVLHLDASRRSASIAPA